MNYVHTQESFVMMLLETGNFWLVLDVVGSFGLDKILIHGATLRDSELETYSETLHSIHEIEHTSGLTTYWVVNYNQAICRRWSVEKQAHIIVETIILLGT
jgi:hypothetical protein